MLYAFGGRSAWPPPPRCCLWRQHLSVASSIGWQQMMRRWDVIVEAVDESLSGAKWKHVLVKLSIIKISARDTNISGLMLIRRDWWLCAMHETKSIKWSENIIYRMDKEGGHSEGRGNKNMRLKGDVLSNHYTRLNQCRSVGATVEGSEVKNMRWRRILLEIWFQLLCWDTFLRLSPRAFLGGPHPGLFMSWASEHRERKMDTFACFAPSVPKNERDKIRQKATVINSPRG